MSKKRRLSIPKNRAHIKTVFAETRDSLKGFDRTLYHYVSANHAMRTESRELLRRFAALDKQLAEKIKNGARYI